MGALELLFYASEGVRAIFELGFIPHKSEFFAFTEREYECYEKQIGPVNEKKLFQIIPKNYKYLLPNNEVNTVSEAEVEKIIMAGNVLKRYGDDSGYRFENDEELLYYCASVMPSIFSENTKFDPKKLRLIKNSGEKCNVEREQDYETPQLQLIDNR